jgi:hypothetical protein
VQGRGGRPPAREVEIRAAMVSSGQCLFCSDNKGEALAARRI